MRKVFVLWKPVDPRVRGLFLFSFLHKSLYLVFEKLSQFQMLYFNFKSSSVKSWVRCSICSLYQVRVSKRQGSYWLVLLHEAVYCWILGMPCAFAECEGICYFQMEKLLEQTNVVTQISQYMVTIGRFWSNCIIHLIS